MWVRCGWVGGWVWMWVGGGVCLFQKKQTKPPTHPPTPTHPHPHPHPHPHLSIWSSENYVDHKLPPDEIRDWIERRRGSLYLYSPSPLYLLLSRHWNGLLRVSTLILLFSIWFEIIDSIMQCLYSKSTWWWTFKQGSKRVVLAWNTSVNSDPHPLKSLLAWTKSW
jgi:hypothetical protein